MKSLKLGALLIVIAVIVSLTQLRASDVKTATFEYATIRWAGKEDTHIVRPGGRVEFIGTELRKVRKPDRADDRAFYLNSAMNGLTKEGYEFAGMTSDEIVMKRSIAR